MRARWMAALATAGLLAVPASAAAGGWATVELSSTPEGVSADETWTVELTVLQHGRTPLDDVEPTVTVAKARGGESRSVTATPTGEAGVYRASVTFPSAGRWTYTVHDGFSREHSYPPVQIRTEGASGAPVLSAGNDEGSLWPPLAAALAAGIGAAGLTSVLRRRRDRRALDDIAPAGS